MLRECSGISESRTPTHIEYCESTVAVLIWIKWARPRACWLQHRRFNPDAAQRIVPSCGTTTPSLPLAPMPIGHSTEVLLPTFDFQ